MIVNDNIKYIREISELTQAQFSNIFRIPLSSLKNWENTDVMPKVELLNNLAKVLNLSVDVLVNRKLTSSDINWKRLDMEKIVRGEKDLDKWIDTHSSSSEPASNPQEKFVELQSEYISTLKLQEEALTHFRDLLKDVNDQRMIDVKVLIGRTDELSKRLDRLEAQFDETKKGLYTMIMQIDVEFRERLDQIDEQLGDSTEDFTERLKKIEFYLDQKDPKFSPRYED